MTTHLILKPARFLMPSLLIVLALFSMPTKAEDTGVVDDPDNGILTDPPTTAPSSPAPSSPPPSSSHPPPTYQLTVEKVGMGTIQGKGIHCGSDCLERYIIDTPVTLTAIPADAFRFTGWKGDCDTSGQVQMTADKFCTAIFTPYSAGYASTPPVGTDLNFGQTMVGKAINLRLVVEETGDLPLKLKSALFVDQQADAFRILSGKPPVIIPNAGKAHGLLLQCLPQTDGIHETTLILTTNDPSQTTIRYPVTCEGVKKVFIAYDSEPAPSSTLNWTSVVGMPSVVSLTVSETGTDTLDILEASFSGQHASDFSLIEAKLPLSLPDGDSSQTLKVHCLPSVVGVREATLTLTTTDPVQPTVTYTLKCTGLKPATYASEPVPSSTLSMRAKVGQSGVVDLKIVEVGDSPLEITQSQLTGEHKAEFSIPAGQLPLTISEGEPAHTLTVQCIPRALGTRTATLSLMTNDPAQPTVTYPLQCLGLGTPGYSSVPAPESTLAFGRSLVGTAITHSLTIQETGNTTLTLNESRLSGTHASDFRVVTLPLSLNDGDAAQPITLECVPSEAGDRVATLHLTTNDPVLPSISYTLTCEGLDPARHHPPTDIVLSNNTVLANVKVDTLIGHLSTVDPDPSDEHRYTLTASGPFKIVDNQLRVAAVLTAGDDPITITTTDSTELAFTKNFSIQVTKTIITTEVQANRQPADISLSNDTLSQNSEIGTPIGLVSTLDFDRHDVHSYTLTDDAGGRFQIVDNQLQLASEVEIKPYTITITTTDKAGSTLSKDFIITIHGNEAPIDILLLGETVEKKTPTGAWVSTLYTVDPNPDDEHRYTLNNDAKGRFKIIGNELRVADKSVGFKSGATYPITITTTDPGKLSFRKEFTIQVCDQAHALYHVEENRLFMPLLDVWLFDPITQQALKEVGVFKGDLMLITGTEDLKVVTDSLAFLYTLPKPSACHARYQNNRFYIPYLDVPSVSAWPKTRSPAQIQTFAVVLKALSTDYTVFHLESYKIR